MNKGALTFLGVVKENVTPWDIIQCALRIFVFHVQYKVILLNAHGQRLETSPGNKYGKKLGASQHTQTCILHVHTLG